MIIVVLIRNQVLDYIEVGLIFWFFHEIQMIYLEFQERVESYMEISDCCILENIKNIWKFLHFSSHFSSFVCAQFFKWLKNFKASFHLSNLTLIREKERIFDYCIQIISNVSRFHGEIFLKKARNSKNSNPELYCSNFRILYTFYNSRNCDLDLDEAKQRL